MTTRKAININTLDGHRLQVYRAGPSGGPKGGLLVLQEIFGVTAHIRRVADDYAGRGFLVYAPALFDRIRPGVELAYGEIDLGRTLMQQLKIDEVAIDLAAAVSSLAEELAEGLRIGAVGYCWGGAIADLAACRVPIQAAVSYYGRANVGWLNEAPRCPVLYHFGAKDPLIPPEVIQQIRAGRPDAPAFVYPEAGHGFNCDERPEFHGASAALALERSLAFFDQHLQPARA